MRKYKKIREIKQNRIDLVARAILAEERVEELRVNITKSENRIMKLLDKLEYEYIFQYSIFDEWFFIIADFYIPEFKLMIEVDGDSHLGVVQKKKETKRKRWLLKKGIQVLRIKNKATIKMNAKQLNSRILKFVDKNK
jgi:very-short-patch-repair endonuclease